MIYKLAIGVALKLGLPSIDMKLATAVFFVLVIMLQKEGWRKKLLGMFNKEGGRNA